MKKTLPALMALLLIIACTGADNGEDETELSENDTKTELNGKEKEEVNNVDQQKLNSQDQEDEYDEYGDTEEYENDPPVIKSIRIQTLSANPRDGFKADIVSEDPEGDEVDYIYQWKHNGEDIQGATESVLEWRDEFSKGDSISLEVIPYDDEAEGIWKSEGTFTIPNAPPVIRSSPEGAVSGNSFNYKVIAEDPDGDPFTLSLKNAPEDMGINNETGEIVWNFSSQDAGNYNIDIVATDDEGAYSVQNVTFTISEEN